MSWFSVWLKKGFKISISLVWPGENKLKDPDNYRKRKDAVEEIIDNLDKKKQGGKNGSME
jgi:hypothetical protein